MDAQNNNQLDALGLKLDEMMQLAKEIEKLSSPIGKTDDGKR